MPKGSLKAEWPDIKHSEWPEISMSTESGDLM